VRLESVKDNARPKYWSKDLVKRDLGQTSLKIKALCKLFGGEDHWRQVYNDVWRWRQTDPEFGEIFEIYRQRVGMSDNSRGGRPLLEEGNNWKQDFCDALIKFNGNRQKAASVTPYAFKTILEKLRPGYTSYDKDFSEMVRAVELSISARSEEILIESAMRFENIDKVDLATAKVLDVAARINEKVIQKLDSDRWGRRLDVAVTGVVKHQLESREDRLERLIRDQHEVMKIKGIPLPMALPEKTEDPVLEAEFDVVQEKVEA